MKPTFDPSRFDALAKECLAQPRAPRTIDALLDAKVSATVLGMVDAGRTYREIWTCMTGAGLKISYQAFAKAITEFLELAQKPSRKDRLRRIRQEALARRMPAAPENINPAGRAAPIRAGLEGKLPDVAERRRILGRSAAEIEGERLKRS